MLKLVVFDWNGTILSDSKTCVDADNHVFKLFNLKPLTLKRFRETFDIPLDKYYAANGLNEKMFWENLTLVQDTFHKQYNILAKKCRTRAGAKKLLKWLSGKKIESVILSNHVIEDIESHLSRLKLKKFFKTILANKQHYTVCIKSKQEMLQSFLQKNRIKRSETIIIGDAPEEIEIARKLGLKAAISLSDGFYSKKRLKALKPDYLIDNLNQAIPILTKQL